MAKQGHTVLDILNKTTDWFEQKSVPESRLNAQHIIAHSLGMKRMDLYLNFDRPVAEKELELIRKRIARRAEREPLEHVLGETEFRSLKIKCDKRALIPRPETELLVDRALDFIKQKEKSEQNVLEIGVGTGAVILSLAAEADQNLNLIGVDVSKDALTLAQENAKLNGIETVRWLESDVYSALGQEKFDLIVSNPPYITSLAMNDLQREVKEYDPRLALDGGEDGLDVIRRILDEGASFLFPSFKPSIMSFSEVFAERIKIGVSRSFSRIPLHTPKPSIPGSIKSKIIKS
jgi:release factor glutamine methyltransferase